jgi:putative membrane protein
MKNIKHSILKTVAIFVIAIFTTTSIFSQNETHLTDPEVASVAVVANQIDISYAEIALEKSKNEEILKFAKRMVTDHNAVIKQAVALVTKLSVTPKDNAVSMSLLEDAEKTKKKLRKAKRKKFDKLYIDNEVAYHKAVIAAIRDLLIPESDNIELKELLQSVLPALEAHLGHAEMVQKKLYKW